MKYLLTNFVNNLRTEEVRYFKLFSSNYSQKGQTKRTTELFDLLRDEKFDEYSDDLVVELFDTPNSNAYYRLKNRLLRNLEQSFITFHQEKDDEFLVLNKIRLGSIFMNRSRPDEAFAYFQEAEKLAEKQQAYHLLIIIYGKFVSLCSINHEIDPKPFIEKRQNAISKYKNIYEGEELLASMSYQLRRSNFSLKEEGMIVQLEKLMEEMQLTQLDQYPTSFRLKVHKLARNILLQKREFEALGVYLEESLISFEQENFFTRKNYEEKIVILVWLVNSLSRAKEVEKTGQYAEELGRAISSHKNLFYDKYVWLYYQSEMVVRILQNRPDDAITLLEKLATDKKYENIVSFFSVYLNLALLYYYIGNLEKGLEYLGRIIISSDYRNISPILQLNIGIVELILSIEARNYNYSEGRYKELRRKYRKELSKEAYSEEKMFLEILRDFISKPDAESRPKTRKRMQTFVKQFSDYEIGANESLNYSIWLQSRIKRQSYYQVMLEKYYDKW